jgi:signal peptide peptidase SppA
MSSTTDTTAPEGRVSRLGGDGMSLLPGGPAGAELLRGITAALQQMAEGGQVLRMIEESHADFLRQRFAARPISRGKEGEERGPQSIARFPNAAQTGGYGYAVDAAGIAIVNIKGAITPEAWAWYDDDETISDWIVRDLDAMAADAAVKGVLFVISSPGGYVAGSFEMADAIARLAATKPTGTFTVGYCCSAAFLNAVGTDHITAYRTALVGSIGTRSAVIDARELFAKFGLKMIPLDSGGMKSAGLIGTEVTPEQIAYLRGTVLKLQELFTQAVADGRGVALEQAQTWADGRVHVAGDGKSLGLIDAVGTMGDAYATLTKKVGGGPRTRGKTGSRKAKSEIETNSTTAGADAGGISTTAEAAAAGASAPPTGSEAGSQAGGTSPEKGPDMSQTTTAGATAAATAPAPEQPKAATMAELRAACPGASSDFLVEAAEKGHAVAQAKDAFIGWQAAQIRSRDEAMEKTKTDPAPQQQQRPAGGGTRSIEAGAAEGAGGKNRASAGGDAVAEFNTAVEEQMAKPGYKDRKKAIAQVCRTQPELHQAYLIASNPGAKQRAQIRERFDADAA